MPGLEMLWFVQRRAYRGISAQPSSTRSAQRRSSRFGSGSGILWLRLLRFHLDPERAGHDDLVRRNRDTRPDRRVVQQQIELAHVVHAGSSLQDGGDIRQEDVAAE